MAAAIGGAGFVLVVLLCGVVFVVLLGGGGILSFGSEPATCRDLAERLQRGIDARWMRKQNKPPAIFIVKKDDERNAEFLEDVDDVQGGWAIVIQDPTAAEAREVAGTLRTGFAYDRFVIYGDPAIVGELPE
jgi:hypothetical protein